MSDLISRKALLEELKNTYVPVSVKLIDLITNAPAINSLQNCDAQGEPVTFGGIVRTYKASPPQEQDKLVKKAVKDALEKSAKIVQAKIGHYYPTPLTDAVTEIRALIEKE